MQNYEVSFGMSRGGPTGAGFVDPAVESRRHSPRNHRSSSPRPVFSRTIVRSIRPIFTAAIFTARRWIVAGSPFGAAITFTVPRWTNGGTAFRTLFPSFLASARRTIRRPEIARSRSYFAAPIPFARRCVVASSFGTAVTVTVLRRAERRRTRGSPALDLRVRGAARPENDARPHRDDLRHRAFALGAPSFGTRFIPVRPTEGLRAITAACPSARTFRRFSAQPALSQGPPQRGGRCSPRGGPGARSGFAKGPGAAPGGPQNGRGGRGPCGCGPTRSANGGRPKGGPAPGCPPVSDRRIAAISSAKRSMRRSISFRRSTIRSSAPGPWSRGRSTPRRGRVHRGVRLRGGQRSLPQAQECGRHPTQCEKST